MTAAARSTHVDGVGELIRLALEGKLQDVHVCMPGKVKDYDASTRTATIEPALRRPGETFDGDVIHASYPDLPNVPIVFPGSGACSITWPIAVGSHVLLVFGDGDGSQWRETGEQSNVDTLRRHSLANAYAIPGVRPNTDVLPAAQKNAIVITGAEVRLATDSDSADFVPLAQKVLDGLNDIRSKFDTHIHAVAAAPGNTAVPTALMGNATSVAATKVRAV